MKLLNEFREFAMRGNVMDMAVGIIIGGAFGKIVTSMVRDILTPIISVFTGGMNFSDLALKLKETPDSDPLLLNWEKVTGDAVIGASDLSNGAR